MTEGLDLVTPAPFSVKESEAWRSWRPPRPGQSALQSALHLPALLGLLQSCDSPELRVHGGNSEPPGPQA